MALQSIANIVAPRTPAGTIANAPSFGNVTVDADGEGIGMVFQAPVTGTITGFGCRTGTLTAGDANTLFSLRNVDLTSTPGIPGGTTHASGTVNVAASNTWYNVSGLSYAATQGEMLSVTVTRPTSGSLNTIFSTFADDTGSSTNLPYGVANASAGWVVDGNGPLFAINYGGTYYPLFAVWPMSTTTNTAYSSSSTPDVIGNVWIPRFKCRVRGVWLWADLDAGLAVKFYDTDGVTVLAQAVIAANSRGADNQRLLVVPFSDSAGETTVTPTVGATYRIGIEPSSTTNIGISDFTVSAAAIMDAFDLGQSMYYTSAKDPTGTGSWTDVTTRRVFMGVLIDQLDDGAGSGGVVGNSGMYGGMQ